MSDQWPGQLEQTAQAWPGQIEQDNAPSPPISANNTPGTFAEGVFLPRPAVSQSAMPFVNSTTTGGIMKAFGQEFDQTFGPEQLGISKEDTAWLSKIGIFGPEKGGYQNPFQAFNEGVMVNTAAFLDGVIRTANSTYRGLQAAGVEAGLPGDVVSIPDAFMGSPHPTGMFKQATLKELLATIKEPKPVPPVPEGLTLTGSETHPTEIPSPEGIFGEQSFRPYVPENPTFADLEGLAPQSHWPYPLLYNDPVAALHEAQDLGVIGPDKPVLADMADKPVAEAVDALRPKPDNAPEAASPSQDSWRGRFEHFVGKLTQPEEIRQLIRDSADENNDFPAAQQGRISLGDAQNLADAAGMDISEVDRDKLGGELMTPAHVDRAMQVMIQATRNVKDAARDVVSDASEENLIKFQEHLLRRDMAVETIVGIRANWGRVGNVLNSYLKDVKDGNALESFIKETCPL